MKARSDRSNGFSLIELAVVLVIIALLTAGAIAALRAQTERSRLLETHAQLREAREALLNFAAVNGALPCPDTNGDGEVDSCGANNLLTGALPWKTLALPSSDIWGQALGYAVSRNFSDSANLSLSSKGSISIIDGNAQSLANPEAVALALWSKGSDSTDNTLDAANSRLQTEISNSDDMVLWLSRFVLLGRMLEAGRDIPQ